MADTPRIIESALDDISPGALLAKDLLDNRGNILLPAGKIIDETLIERLKSRGINSLPISVPQAPEDLEAAQRAVQDRVDHVFRHCQGLAATQLRTIILQHRLRYTGT